MQVTVIKDQLVKQAVRFASDNSYKQVVTLESVFDEYTVISMMRFRVLRVIPTI
jgi:hypothetical protein